ncbi:MAG: hypothetical protein ACREP0_12485 [Rhodanobacteraceae bacterium]
MNDAQIIQSAYADALGRAFKVLVDALAAAGGDATAESRAANEFKTGVALVRKARDEALQLVQ